MVIALNTRRHADREVMGIVCVCVWVSTIRGSVKSPVTKGTRSQGSVSDFETRFVRLQRSILCPGCRFKQRLIVTY